jgi:parallel beta-helix repeat protein
LFPEELVPRGATWKYFRGLAEPAGGSLDWTAPGFDDASWQTGAAGFGYADGDDATVLSDMNGGYSTLYLRRTFEVADPARIRSLDLSIDYDDGYIAFLNGKEIARANAGDPGSYPGNAGLATDSREAGTPEIARREDAGTYLLPGTNVLAVMGLNAARTNSDFSLHPALRSGDVIAEGCPGDYYVAGPGILLEGTAAPPAAAVRVNGSLAAFDPTTGGWSHRPALAGSSTTLAVEALNASGAVIASRMLRAIRARALGGAIDVDTTLGASGGPLIVMRQVSLAAGRRLTIGPGCELLILPGVGFDIAGEVKALGTSAAPIRFTRFPCRENWGFMDFEDATGESAFTHCEWSLSTGDPGCLTLSDTNLVLDGCTIRDIDGEGVHSNGGKSHIRNCLSERTREAFSLDAGDVVVEFCTVRDAIGDSDLIDTNRSTNPPARIAFNHIHGTSDDGIDADGSSVIIEGNVIHDCADQAMSLVGAGNSTVVRNICFRNGNGLSVKDSHETFAEYNTFALNTVTGVRAIERTAGRGGGFIVLRHAIVWGNTVQLLAESGGAIDVSFSDVEGAVVPGPGNISIDPLFIDIAANDFRLQETSPCIGAGETGEDLGAIPHEVAPRGPSDLVATAGSGSVALGWRDNSFYEEGFEVERSLGAGPFERAATLPADARSFTDAGLAAAAYRYRVRAFNDAGASPWAGPVDVTVAVEGPRIDSVDPAEGPAAGGTAVVILGSGFHGSVTVLLGGAPMSAVEAAGPGEILAVTPAGIRGPADMRVVAEGGETFLGAAFAYFDAHLRGDATGDGLRNISDAISILDYLFQGGPGPPCSDVADANGDAEVNISDPVHLLLHLFAAGEAPSPDGARCFGEES